MKLHLLQWNITSDFSASFFLTCMLNYLKIIVLLFFASNYVLQKTSGFDDFGTPVWHMTLCLLFSWIVVVLSLIKGIQSLGKVRGTAFLQDSF